MLDTHYGHSSSLMENCPSPELDNYHQVTRSGRQAKPTKRRMEAIEDLELQSKSPKRQSKSPKSRSPSHKLVNALATPVSQSPSSLGDATLDESSEICSKTATPPLALSTPQSKPASPRKRSTQPKKTSKPKKSNSKSKKVSKEIEETSFREDKRYGYPWKRQEDRKLYITTNLHEIITPFLDDDIPSHFENSDGSGMFPHIDRERKDESERRKMRRDDILARAWNMIKGCDGSRQWRQRQIYDYIKSGLHPYIEDYQKL